MSAAFLASAIVLFGVATGNTAAFLIGILLVLLVLFFAVGLFWHRPQHPHLSRALENPLLRPVSSHPWESEAVFNPAALYHGGRVHLLYRALGGDGVSRIGYASSSDGIHFDERLPYPIFVPRIAPRAPSRFQNPFASSERYDRDLYASGGGWGGSEDPRAVAIDGQVYMTFGMFESWNSMRIGLTYLSSEEFSAKLWRWAPHLLISPAGQTHKNWVLFPEKINGRFAILHALTPRIEIAYIDSLDSLADNPIHSNNHRSGRPGKWDAFVRGAGAPPLKTLEGWLLLYHGMNPQEPVGYKLGAMLLDLKDPTIIRYRSPEPILVPTEWYENDWKPGVVYGSGAVIKDGTLFVYYGGGDKTVSVATAPLNQFLDALMAGGHPALAGYTS